MVGPTRFVFLFFATSLVVSNPLFAVSASLGESGLGSGSMGMGSSMSSMGSTSKLSASQSASMAAMAPGVPPGPGSSMMPGMAPPGMAPPGMAPPGMAPPGMAPPGMAPGAPPSSRVGFGGSQVPGSMQPIPPIPPTPPTPPTPPMAPAAAMQPLGAPQVVDVAATMREKFNAIKDVDTSQEVTDAHTGVYVPPFVQFTSSSLTHKVTGVYRRDLELQRGAGSQRPIYRRLGNSQSPAVVFWQNGRWIVTSEMPTVENPHVIPWASVKTTSFTPAFIRGWHVNPDADQPVQMPAGHPELEILNQRDAASFLQLSSPSMPSIVSMKSLGAQQQYPQQQITGPPSPTFGSALPPAPLVGGSMSGAVGISSGMGSFVAPMGGQMESDVKKYTPQVLQQATYGQLQQQGLVPPSSGSLRGSFSAQNLPGGTLHSAQPLIAGVQRHGAAASANVLPQHMQQGLQSEQPGVHKMKFDPDLICDEARMGSFSKFVDGYASPGCPSPEGIGMKGMEKVKGDKCIPPPDVRTSRKKVEYVLDFELWEDSHMLNGTLFSWEGFLYSKPYFVARSSPNPKPVHNVAPVRGDVGYMWADGKTWFITRQLGNKNAKQTFAQWEAPKRFAKMPSSWPAQRHAELARQGWTTEHVVQLKHRTLQGDEAHKKTPIVTSGLEPLGPSVVLKYVSGLPFDKKYKIDGKYNLVGEFNGYPFYRQDRRTGMPGFLLYRGFSVAADKDTWVVGAVLGSPQGLQAWAESPASRMAHVINAPWMVWNEQTRAWQSSSLVVMDSNNPMAQTT